MIDALVKLSINQLTGLPQSEVLMLRMSDWTMEGNCSWLEWMERVLTHEMAGDSSTQAGALVSDYITVRIECFWYLYNLIISLDSGL